MLEILWIIAGGILYRIRGGWLSLPSTFLGRMVFCVPTGLFLWYLSGVWYLAPLGTIAIFLGILNGWGTFMDMGRTTDLNTDDDPPIYWIVGREDNSRPFWQRWLRDFVGMSLRGVLICLPVGLLLMVMIGSSMWWILGGLAISIWYELDNQLMDKGLNENSTPWRNVIGAELLTGMWLFYLLTLPF